MKNLILLLTLLTSLSSLGAELTSNDYEFCDSTSNSDKCEQYIYNCSEDNETKYNCSMTFLNMSEEEIKYL